MATKKQVSELEGVVISLEERIEKMEEEHAMLKQMISMQSSLIDNLQMMVKMMSPSPMYTMMHHVGGASQAVPGSTMQAPVAALADGEVANTTAEQEGGADKKKSNIQSMRHRMSRVI